MSILSTANSMVGADHADLPTGLSIRLPIAKTHQVYSTQEVERKLQHLREQGVETEQKSLVSTYERMLATGPERFAVKPSGLPDMDDLYACLPNFTEVLDEIRRSLALAQSSSDGLQLTPILLLGSPGVGKTHFARQIADLLGTGMSLVPMSSMTAGWILSGSSSQWRGAKPGKVFDALVNGQYANPVIVVDEVDKANADAQYDPLGALYSLLEHDTAQRFVDEFVEVAIDTSQVSWFMTANDERMIPEPILNRMNVFEIQPPSPEAARKIAQRLYATILSEHDWGRHFASDPTDAVLDCFSHMPPREMRRAWMTALGNACLDKRYIVMTKDLPQATSLSKQRVGFVH